MGKVGPNKNFMLRVFLINQRTDKVSLRLKHVGAMRKHWAWACWPASWPSAQVQAFGLLYILFFIYLII